MPALADRLCRSRVESESPEFGGRTGDDAGATDDAAPVAGLLRPEVFAAVASTPGNSVLASAGSVGSGPEFGEAPATMPSGLDAGSMEDGTGANWTRTMFSPNPALGWGSGTMLEVFSWGLAAAESFGRVSSASSWAMANRRLTVMRSRSLSAVKPADEIGIPPDDEVTSVFGAAPRVLTAGGVVGAELQPIGAGAARSVPMLGFIGAACA